MSASYLPMLARAFGVRLTDYRRASTGMLVGSGCGLMMAAMDACEQFRWCFDIDAAPGVQLERFLRIAAEVTEPLAVCGWFSITDPTPLRLAVAGMRKPPVVYAGNIRLGAGREAASLSDFFRLLAPS